MAIVQAVKSKVEEFKKKSSDENDAWASARTKWQTEIQEQSRFVRADEDIDALVSFFEKAENLNKIHIRLWSQALNHLHGIKVRHTQ